ncbi:MAG: YceI family protein, partial [Marinirhabdus sp.]|nr:YceI family protein [Marinirhabdus sp.]
MKKNIAILILALSSTVLFTACNEGKETKTGEAETVATAADTAAMYTVNTDNTVINWNGSKPTGTHTGTVQVASGEMAVVEGMIQSGEFTIDMTSIEVTDLEAGNGKENLESHLMGTVEGKEGDFFNVNKYPTATFEITGVEGEANNATVKGNLTIKGKTNNIEFPATVTTSGNTMTLRSSKF